MKSILMAAAAVCALGLPAVAQADARSDAVARYVAWRGGSAFEKADGLLVKGVTDNGRFKGALERRIEPGRTLEKFNLGSATTHRAFIGDSGWTVSLSGQVETASKGAAQQAANRRLALFDDALRGDKLSLQPDETFDGKTVQVLRASFDERDRYDLLIDPATGALIADRLVESGQSTLTRYDDWRTVEGVRIAFKEVQQIADDPFKTTITLTSADLNPKADAKAFARPTPKQIFAFADGKTATAPMGFEFYLGSRIYIPATINGAQTHVLLDSGAEATVLDKAFAESIGLKASAIVPAAGTGGRDVAELASGVTIRIGDMTLRDITVALMDLKPIADMIGRPLPVILGKEVFNELVVDLDFASKTIAFQDPAKFTPKPGAVPVPVTSTGGIHAIPASLEGGEPVLFDFDLGNGGPLLVFPGYWKPRGMLADRPTSKSLSGAIGGLKTRSVATVKTLTLAGVTFRDIPAVFGDEDGSALDATHTQGNIGMPILNRFDLTTDYPRNRLLLKPRAEAVALPFTKDRSGLVPQLKDGGFVLAMVSPGSPAETAGLKAGQVITAVEGKPAAELGVAGLSKLRTAPAGMPLKLTLSSGETVNLILKDYY
ncbi:aspartyl protease family protein [Caulobacter segnis]|uniref:aspartyl protease family protein n=1 Tax=Caulobacter segnis TaxID=88688 RepID=UPI00240EB2BA|nr:aspartyl protease family protein [Caulobacter segnis]MDG2521760.1 aspartyl protease family protein [Caulobacter segnis]